MGKERQEIIHKLPCVFSTITDTTTEVTVMVTKKVGGRGDPTIKIKIKRRS
jgi:hypothetical protein